MITIWRTEIDIVDEQKIDVPAGSGLPLALLMLETPLSTPTLWYAVDSEAPLIKRTIYCVGTGADASHVFTKMGRTLSADHIGTLFHRPSRAVLHFFQRRVE